MKELIHNWDKAFENKTRLGIMAMLVVDDWVDFNSMKEQLQLTDGNLASHTAALEKIQYIEVKKAFVGKKPNTSFRVTAAGRQAFTKHLNALENFIRSQS